MFVTKEIVGVGYAVQAEGVNQKFSMYMGDAQEQNLQITISDKETKENIFNFNIFNGDYENKSDIKRLIQEILVLQSDNTYRYDVTQSYNDSRLNSLIWEIPTVSALVSSPYMIEMRTKNANEIVSQYYLTVDPKFVLLEAYNQYGVYEYVHLHSLLKIPSSILQVINQYLFIRKIKFGY